MKFQLFKTCLLIFTFTWFLLGFQITLNSQKLDSINESFLIGGSIGGLFSKATLSGDPHLQQIINSSKYNADIKMKMYYFWNHFHGLNLSLGFLSGSSFKLDSNISDIYEGKQVVYLQNYTPSSTICFDIGLGYNYRLPISHKMGAIFGVNAGLLFEDYIDQYSFLVKDFNAISEEYYYYQLIHRKSPSLKLGIDASINYTVGHILMMQLAAGLDYWQSRFQYSSFKQDHLLNQYEDKQDFNPTNIFPKISLGLFLNVPNLVRL